MSMMEDYITILNATAQTPNQEMRGLVQALTNEQWENTTLKQMVNEETAHGTFIFTEQEVWKDTITEFLTNSLKDEKNYRRLLFQDSEHSVERGRYYEFDDNYWLTYAPTNDIELYNDIYVQRCNNIAKWIDKDTNVLYELPCIIDYDDSSPTTQVNSDITTPNNGLILMIQGNDNTVKFKQNQRFIFNGRPFKITGYNNYMQDDYVTKDTPLLFFDVYLDEILPNDDIDNGIANATNYNYTVSILENPVENIQGFECQLNAVVQLNGNDTNNIVTWSANDNATIDANGNCVLTGAIGTVATITASFGQAKATININIVESVTDNLEIVIDPEITMLKQNRSITFSANLYKNGTKQNDTVTATISGADSVNNYSWTELSNNQFTLTNKLRSISPLMITFISGETTQNMSIVLGSMI